MGAFLTIPLPGRPGSLFRAKPGSLFRANQQHIAEEVKHYTLVADVAEWLAGRPLTAAEAREYEVCGAASDDSLLRERQANPRLPEANAMLELRWRFRTEHPGEFSDAVMRLKEGRGGG